MLPACAVRYAGHSAAAARETTTTPSAAQAAALHCIHLALGRPAAVSSPLWIPRGRDDSLFLKLATSCIAMMCDSRVSEMLLFLEQLSTILFDLSSKGGVRSPKVPSLAAKASNQARTAKEDKLTSSKHLELSTDQTDQHAGL